jgi:aspartate/methionine/tyrosine aminotransferase
MLLHQQGIISKPVSEGGYYVFIKLLRTSFQSGWAIIESLVERYGIAVVPGEAFGIESEPYIRISYGNITPDKMSVYAELLSNALYQIRLGSDLDF